MTIERINKVYFYNYQDAENFMRRIPTSALIYDPKRRGADRWKVYWKTYKNS